MISLSIYASVCRNFSCLSNFGRAGAFGGKHEGEEIVRDRSDGGPGVKDERWIKKNILSSHFSSGAVCD